MNKLIIELKYRDLVEEASEISAIVTLKAEGPREDIERITKAIRDAIPGNQPEWPEGTISEKQPKT